jgi:hypothetical protein
VYNEFFGQVKLMVSSNISSSFSIITSLRYDRKPNNSCSSDYVRTGTSGGVAVFERFAAGARAFRFPSLVEPQSGAGRRLNAARIMRIIAPFLRAS